MDDEEVTRRIKSCINDIYAWWIEEEPTTFPNWEDYINHRFGNVKRIIEEHFGDVSNIYENPELLEEK